MSDLDIDRDPANTIDLILRGELTEEFLSKSISYKNDTKDQKDIVSRIQSFKDLEQYLDVNNTIKLFSLRLTPFQSSINAEYFIKSQLFPKDPPVYIFIRKRSESDNYCIVSFFREKDVTYSGEAVYWMEKKKIHNTVVEVLYRHPNYTPAV